MPITISNPFAVAQNNVNQSDPVNRKHPLAKGLVGWWLCLPHRMGSAKWHDISGYRNNGALTGVFPSSNGFRGSSRPGGFGSLLFDGVTTAADLGSPAILNITGAPLTISAWIYQTVIVARNNNIISGPANGYEFYVAGSDSKLHFGKVNVADDIISNTVFVLNQWYHVAVTYLSTTMTLYVNGKQDTSVTITRTYSSGLDYQLGYFQGGSATNHFNGNMDDVRVYNRGLSAIEIAQMYHNSQQGYPGLINRTIRKMNIGPLAVVQSPNGPSTSQPTIKNNLRHTQLVNRKHALANGLSAWWLALPSKLGSSAFLDIVGQNHAALVRVNSTANGFRPTTHQGGFGSLLFDNTAFNANAGNVLHPSGAFTVSAWVNASSFNTTGGAPTILAKYKDSVGVAKEYIFNFNANNGSQLALICYDDANGAFIGRYYSGTLPTNKWHHVAASYNGGTTTAAIQVYLNGARVDDSNVTAGTFANINSFTTPTMIGAAQSSGNANYFFKGNINDVRFYNRKLNISEIQAMYLNSLQGYPGLLNHTSRFGYFPANKNSGFKGIDIVQTNTELVLRSCMLNNSGAAVTTGSTQIYLFEIQSDGDLKQYDWSTNTFSYGTLSSPSITAKQQGNTGMWTYALFNTQAFTNGAMYIAEFNNSNASPMWQAQEFQFGNQPGDDGFFQEFVAKPNNSLTVLNTNRTEASGYWNSAEIAFTTGSLKGKSAKVSSYSGGSFTLSASLPSTPNVGDRGIIISVQ